MSKWLKIILVGSSICGFFFSNILFLLKKSILFGCGIVWEERGGVKIENKFKS